jgi:hypothetical protein
MAVDSHFIACQRLNKVPATTSTDATDNVQAMKKAIKVVFYTSVAVAGWQALRYFYGRLLASTDLSVEQSSVRDKKAYRRATERWENEGGATLAGHKSGPPH